MMMDRNNSNHNSIGSLGTIGNGNNNPMGKPMTNGNGSSCGGMADYSYSTTTTSNTHGGTNGNANNNINSNGGGTLLVDGNSSSSNTILGLTLLMEQPVIEELDDIDDHEQRANGTTTHWEYHNINLQRIPGYGFGIAVSGGRDNPHFANGDPSIAISDVLKGGPAEGKLSVNDRILSANGVNLENVDYATAVQVLRDNSNVQLVIKRRTIHHSQNNIFKVSVSKGQKKDFAIPLATQLIIKEARSTLLPGDIILKINATPAENLSLKEAKRLIESKDKLELVIQRNSNLNQNSSAFVNQNLYVQQPRRAELTSGPTILPPPPPRPTPPPPRPPPPLDVPDSIPILDSNNTSAITPFGLNSLQQQNTRVIKFRKVQSLGIRLAGGNTSGIYVSAVQPNSPAALQNLAPGDKILSVNGTDLSSFTREEAVQLLLNTHEDVELIVDSKGGVVGGDCFYVKTNCEHTTALKGELSFRKGEIFCVLDSLFGGTIGNWQVERMSNGEKGIIPNKSRFEETMTKGLNTSFFKKKTTPIVYERVVFDRVPYTRPVVLLGVGSSIAKNRLVKDYPREFQALDNPTTTLSYTKIRISTIRSIINSNRHCLMSNISSPIEKLDLLYPIVILLKTDDKNIIKELVGSSSGLSGKNNWKKLEKSWGSSIHAILEIIDSNWCGELKEIIDQEQNKCTWIREDDFKQQPSTQNPAEPDYLILNHESYISTSELLSSTTTTTTNVNSDPKISLPDYNAPPPYAVGNTNSMEKKIEIAKLSTVTVEKYTKPNYNFMPAVQQPMEQTPSSYSLGRNKILAHTPPPIPPPETRLIKSAPAKPPPAVDRSKKPERKQFDDPYTIFTDKLNYSQQNGGPPYNYTKSLPSDHLHHRHPNNSMSTDLNGNPISSAISLSPSPLLVPTIDQSYHSLTTLGNNNNWRQQQQQQQHGTHHHNGGTANHNNTYDNANNHSSTPTNYYHEDNRISTNGNGNPYKMDSHHLNSHNNNRSSKNSNHETSIISSNNVYLTPPRPKMKPVPPPKPTKPLDLYSNTYLNVPRRRDSAFQLYNNNSNGNSHRSSSKSSSTNNNHNSSHNRKYVMLGEDDDDNNLRSSSTKTQPPNIHSIRKILDTNGGNLALNGVLLEIPKGALEAKVEITMEIIDPVQKGTFQSPIVAIKPEGLQFLLPVRLSIPHWINSDVTSYLKVTNNDLIEATEDNHYIHVLLNSI